MNRSPRPTWLVALPLLLIVLSACSSTSSSKAPATDAASVDSAATEPDVAAALDATAPRDASQEKGSVTGRLRPPEGLDPAVLVGAQVSLRRMDTGGGDAGVIGTPTAPVADDGAFRVADVDPGQYAFEADIAGCLPAAQNLLVPPGTTVSLGDVRLVALPDATPPVGSVSGTAVPLGSVS